ncbi:MAG: hypothetical protein WAV25_00240 [Minisyncoccia bacterium]
MQQQTKTLLIIAGIIVLVLVGYVWYSSTNKSGATLPNTSTTAKTEEVKPRSDVTVKQAEVTDTGKSLKLPAGFPTTIPVETMNVTESYSAFYQTHNSTQYTVTYTSTATIASKWDEYEAFMSKNGYTINKATSIKSKGIISGTKTGESLLVVINAQGGKTLVHITLLKQG